MAPTLLSSGSAAPDPGRLLPARMGARCGISGSSRSLYPSAMNRRVSRENQHDAAALRGVWSTQEPGHYVLRGNARTIGHVVEAADGSFICFDETATPISRHETLRSAQAQLQPPGASAWRRLLCANWGRFIAELALSLGFSMGTASVAAHETAGPSDSTPTTEKPSTR